MAMARLLAVVWKIAASVSQPVAVPVQRVLAPQLAEGLTALPGAAPAAGVDTVAE